MPPTKKYTLFSSPKDGSRPICAFFLSPDGCRNGDNCKFSHGPTSNPPAVSCKTADLETSSVVSSESEDEERAAPAVSFSQKPPTTTPKNNQENADYDDPFGSAPAPRAVNNVDPKPKAATPKNNIICTAGTPRQHQLEGGTAMTDALSHERQHLSQPLPSISTSWPSCGWCW